MFAKPLQANFLLRSDWAAILVVTLYRIVCVMDALNLSPCLVFVRPVARVANPKVANPKVTGYGKGVTFSGMAFIFLWVGVTWASDTLVPLLSYASVPFGVWDRNYGIKTTFVTRNRLKSFGP